MRSQVRSGLDFVCPGVFACIAQTRFSFPNLFTQKSVGIKPAFNVVNRSLKQHASDFASLPRDFGNFWKQMFSKLLLRA
jgi:hypothetical protein